MNINKNSLEEFQKTILLFLSQGLGIKQISHKTGKSKSAIDFHVRKMKDMFRVETNIEMVTIAICHGMITPNPEIKKFKPREKCCVCGQSYNLST